MHPVHHVLLLTGFFSLGGIAGLASTTSWQEVQNTVQAAFTNQYYARTGHIEGNRTFYIRTSDAEALFRDLDKEPSIEDIERAFMNNILVVTISGEITSTFNTIRRHELVKAITALPLFCH